MFWKTLSRMCREKGVSEAALALSLGVSPQTLSTWKARGQFKRSLIPLLRTALEWDVTADRAEKKMGAGMIREKARGGAVGQPNPVDKSMAAVNRAYERLEPTFRRYAAETLPLIQTLGKKCFFIFTSCTSTPYEFVSTAEGETLAAEMAEAVRRGAYLLYIRPTETGVEYYEGEWQSGSVIHREESATEFRRFQEKVVLHLTKGQFPRDIAWLTVYEQTGQCYVDRAPLWFPGLGVGIVGRSDPLDMQLKMTLSLPGGKFGGILPYPHYGLLEGRFNTMARKIVASAVAKLSGRAERTPVVHFDDDARSEIRHPRTLKFYSELDGLLRAVEAVYAPADSSDSGGI